MEQVLTLHKTLHNAGRNDRCPCGSGRKYKRCHGAVVTAPATPTITGPILPDHPLWLKFITMLRNSFNLPEHFLPDRQEIRIDVESYGSTARLVETYYCLKSLGLSQGDLIKNLVDFKRYGGYSDEEIIYNVQKQFYRPINPQKRKIILIGHIGLGDAVIITGVIREIIKACPACEIDIRTNHKDLFTFNPNITKLNDEAEDVEKYIFDIFYLPLGLSFNLHDLILNKLNYGTLWHRFAQIKLKLQWDEKNTKPDLHLENTKNPVREKIGFKGRYWLINSGFHKYALHKWYPYYQKVVDLLRGKIQFIQHGGPGDTHAPLDGALSLVGQTSPLELAAAFRDCQGSLGGASSHAHFAAAFDRPCVAITGGREPPEMTRNNNQCSLFKNIGCSANGPECGCIFTKKDEYGNGCCDRLQSGYAPCMDAITPEEIAAAVLKMNLKENTL